MLQWMQWATAVCCCLVAATRAGPRPPPSIPWTSTRYLQHQQRAGAWWGVVATFLHQGLCVHGGYEAHVDTMHCTLRLMRCGECVLTSVMLATPQVGTQQLRVPAAAACVWGLWTGQPADGRHVQP